MKNKGPIDAAFPKSLMPALKRYLDYYRRILLTESGKAKGLATNALWISRDGTELAEVSLHNAIRRRTRGGLRRGDPAALVSRCGGHVPRPRRARLGAPFRVHSRSQLAGDRQSPL